MYRLTNGEIVNLERITNLGLLECLTWLSYETDLNSQNKVKRNGEQKLKEMVNNKTYNNVVNTLLRLGEYHYQISTTSVGDIYDINLEKMEKFPLMHINPTSVETGDSQLTYNFQIFIMDMVSEKSDWQTEEHRLLTKLVDRENNEQEVFNQTLAICTDIIGMLRHSSRQSLNGVNDINEPIYFTQDQFISGTL